MIKELNDILRNVKESAEFALANIGEPYNFVRDEINGRYCERISEILYTLKGYDIQRCSIDELTKDYVGTYDDGTPFELEIKGDYKSILFGNIFLEFKNTRKDKDSGVMCGNSECLWHHYFFMKDDYTKLHILHSNKGFLRELSMKYKDSIHYTPKSIENARGYAISQSFLFSLEQSNDFRIITINLV